MFVVPGTADGIPTTYNSLIVTRTSKSGIATVASCRATRSLRRPASHLGLPVPALAADEGGVDPDKRPEDVFAGGHDASLLAINGGRVDAGCRSPAPSTSG